MKIIKKLCFMNFITAGLKKAVFDLKEAAEQYHKRVKDVNKNE